MNKMVLEFDPFNGWQVYAVDASGWRDQMSQRCPTMEMAIMEAGQRLGGPIAIHLAAS